MKIELEDISHGKDRENWTYSHDCTLKVKKTDDGGVTETEEYGYMVQGEDMVYLNAPHIYLPNLPTERQDIAGAFEEVLGKLQDGGGGDGWQPPEMPEPEAYEIYLLYVLVKTSFGADARSYGCSVSNIDAERLEEIEKRLERVIVEHKDFEELIKQYDRPDALFYCDPPYHTTERHYAEKFSEPDHYRLNTVLTALKGRFILSYNDDIFIRELYKNFNITAISRSNNLSSGQFKEVIIKNY